MLAPIPTDRIDQGEHIAARSSPAPPVVEGDRAESTQRFWESGTQLRRSKGDVGAAQVVEALEETTPATQPPKLVTGAILVRDGRVAKACRTPGPTAD